MNVLSLFDGISCGQIALNRAGIKYDKYYASEIDPHAIKVAQHNYPETIQLGDVAKIKASNLPKIDLLIGGSPCQGFSSSGKRLNFDDPRSKLFFEYVRLLGELKPKYFLLENVKMKQEHQGIISDFLKTKPTEINSALFSAQRRKRLYWTNIDFDSNIQDKKIMFNKYLYRQEHGNAHRDVYFSEKYPTLLTSHPSANYRIVVDKLKAEIFPDKMVRTDTTITTYLTPEECEALQTIPHNYTAILNKTNRYRCVGNAWTVDVIAHIFKTLRKQK